MKPWVVSVFDLMDWAQATLNMAELPDSLFVTFHDADLTRSCLNKNFIITAQVYGNIGFPSLYRKTEVTLWASLFNC